jgi:nitronate monooxygenase
MATSTAFTDLLGLEYPIVLGPFGGLSSIELTAIVSNGGGLGSFGLYGYTAERIMATTAALRAQTLCAEPVAAGPRRGGAGGDG